MMRFKKCDFCGAMIDEESDMYDTFADIRIDKIDYFEIFEFCENCSDTIVKICKKTRGEEK